jgi:MYXO-CTERM domain-containing protein
MNLKNLIATGLVGASLTPVLVAGTNGFYAPYFRGVPGTDVAGWERFTSGSASANLPDVAGSNTGARAGVTQLDPVGAVLGSGNIYVGIGGAARVRVDYSSLTPIGEVFLQVRTLGTEMDYSALRLNYTTSGGAVSVAGNPFVLDAAPAQGFPGQNISLGYNWTITDPSVTGFNVTFAATGEHLSLDSITLDVLPINAVPEPSTWALGVIGLGALALVRRRSAK